MNIRIEKGKIEQAALLNQLAKTTFIESHAHSSPPKDFKDYMDRHFTVGHLKKELANPAFEYRLLFADEQLVAYSKLIIDTPIVTVKTQNIAKLERIYLSENFLGSGLGKTLFDYNVGLAKSNNQAGIWLFTWVENHRGIAFYKKMGFEIIGSYDFQVSKTHSNPNHQMFLKF